MKNVLSIVAAGAFALYATSASAALVNVTFTVAGAGFLGTGGRLRTCRPRRTPVALHRRARDLYADRSK